jgi:short-subunit dehydrogenase
MKIAGEVAVVTGASSGLGAEMARQLGRLGMKVGLTARREAELNAVADSIRSAGGTAFVAPADASDPSSIKSAIGAIADGLGPVDLLIANAGLAVSTMGHNFSGDSFDRMIRVNLASVGYAIEAVLPRMIRERRGQIVGISSLAGYRGLPGSCGYSATKAGLGALLEGLRGDLRRYGIAVTTVHPGYVRTPMTAGASNFKPLIMDVEPAVRIILRGVAARRTRVDFPWRMAAFLGLVRLLPDWAYDRLAAGLLLGPLDRPDQ